MSSDDFALLDDSDLRLPEDAVDERGIAMVFTGERHFRH